jgi:archaellum biogenesis ATPase FlaH
MLCERTPSRYFRAGSFEYGSSQAEYVSLSYGLFCSAALVDMSLIKSQVEKSLNEVRDFVKDTSAVVQTLSDNNRQQEVFDKLPDVKGSSFDSSDAEHDSRCHPKTRIELLHQIMQWAKDPSSKCIFWLNGMAGTGKSTISRTMAHCFKEKNQLGASFFFKRGEGGRSTAKNFFTTICKQLLLHIPALFRHVELAINANPLISDKAMKEQFTKLLLEPLLSLDQKEPTTTVIVIDALDECGNTDDIRTILQLLPDLQKCKSRHIRIFVTSRPEFPIRAVFEQSNNHRCLILHELSNIVVEEDIRVFLRDEFSRIKASRQVSSEWPDDDVLEILVKRAVPLFISAFTICRFVDGPTLLPEDRLLTLLEDPAATSGSQMDKTYLPVLKQLFSNADNRKKKLLEQEFQDTVGVIILLATPLSVNALAKLTNKSPRNISNHLNGFYSVLSVTQNLDSPVRLLHLSFQDYLLKTEESSFRVSPEKTHQKIALHCLRVMKDDEYGLKRNICGLSSYGTQKVDIDRQTVDQHLSAALQYSCRYWIYHLQQSEGHVSEPEVFPFLEKHFLHWLEAMSLMDIISEAVGMIDMLQRALSVSLCTVHTWVIANTENVERHRKDRQRSL